MTIEVGEGHVSEGRGDFGGGAKRSICGRYRRWGGRLRVRLILAWMGGVVGWGTPLLSGQTLEWTAFNDQMTGAGTGAHVTAWGPFGTVSGNLKNAANGTSVPVMLTVINEGASGATTMADPAAGSPAAEIFGGQIEWQGGSGEAIQLEGEDRVRYRFSGLDPLKRYSFRGTAVRGGSYANRWTRVELTGAVTAVAAHSAGVATTASVPALSNLEAAWNSGENRVGDVVGWDGVDAGSDGVVEIVARRHAGDYPALGAASAGNTEVPTPAPYGYAFQAIRLQQWNPGPPVPPTAVDDTVEVVRGGKVRLAVIENDLGAVDAATVVIVTPPAGGTARVLEDGSVLVAAGSTDTEFRYRVGGPGGLSNVARVRVRIAQTLRLAPLGFNLPPSPPTTDWSVDSAWSGLRFDQPVALASPNGEALRLFVCEKSGVVRVIPDVTAEVPESRVFLDLEALLDTRGESMSAIGERGLLGLAFHPDYAETGFFFIFYTVRKEDGQHYQRVSRFNVEAGDPLAAAMESELVLLEQLDQASNHNGGDVHFGPDGYLYVTVGDEGNQDDSLNNSQTIAKDFFSGILRLDVDRGADSLEPNPHPAILRDNGVARFKIPRGNPWVHTSLGGGWDGAFNGQKVDALESVRTEFWAVGLRNPWRISFDPATGDLYCGDVGGGRREEVNLITRGGNYGWAYREGTLAGPKSDQAPPGFTSIRSVYEYAHGSGPIQGNSITGGLVYRGTKIPGLTGKYVFADYASGNIWALERPVGEPAVVTRLLGETGIAAFGRDPSNGDVLLADIDSGLVRRLEARESAGAFPPTLEATGLFADLADLSPQPGLVEYQINRPFWSDHAIKRRWIALPDVTSQIGWSRDSSWTFPQGTVWVKHFEMEMDRGNPASRQRLETRVLVRTDAGAYGVSYRWNTEGTEAVLVPDEGSSFPLAVISAGLPTPQTWRVPSRAECLACHNAPAGYALSSNTRQFNLAGSLHGMEGNQIDVLRSAGYFGTTPETPNTLPRHTRPGEAGVSLEAQVRSWLAVNCSYCHRAQGPAPTTFDMRPELALSATGLVNGVAANNGGSTSNRLIVPGNPAQSIVLQRIGATNGFTRMPAIGSSVTDPEAVALLTPWISQMLPGREEYATWRLRIFASSSSSAGEAIADPDGDGYANNQEFLLGTHPQDPRSLPAFQWSTEDGQVSVHFQIPENRSWQAQWSPDLRSWTGWDVPGNNGLPAAAGSVTLTRPAAAGPEGYHRVLIQAH